VREYRCDFRRGRWDSQSIVARCDVRRWLEGTSFESLFAIITYMVRMTSQRDLYNPAQIPVITHEIRHLPLATDLRGGPTTADHVVRPSLPFLTPTDCVLFRTYWVIARVTRSS
jgi:hypothetical protein